MKNIPWLFSILLLFVCSASFAQVNTNLDQQASAWIINMTQAGGLNQATSAAIENVTLESGQVVIEPMMSGPEYSNVLFYRNLGVTVANWFKRELDIYIPSAAYANVQATELDLFAYNSPWRFQFGTQCVKGADWNGWNDLLNQWVDLSGVKCNLTANAWHHLEFWYHRDPLSSTACSGNPCTYFDELGVDYQYTAINLKTPCSPIPQGWANQYGVDTQLDLNSNGGLNYEYILHDTVTALGQ